MSYPAYAAPVPEWPEILTWEDLEAVRVMLTEIAPAWSAELNQTGPGELTIVVLPEGANDLIGPAFVLHRFDGRVRLDQSRWDEYRKLGGFRCLDDALAVLRARLVPLVSPRLPETFAQDI